MKPALIYLLEAGPNGYDTKRPGKLTYQVFFIVVVVRTYLSR
jgi:hypothetical protein